MKSEDFCVHILGSLALSLKILGEQSLLGDCVSLRVGIFDVLSEESDDLLGVYIVFDFDMLGCGVEDTLSFLSGQCTHLVGILLRTWEGERLKE